MQSLIRSSNNLSAGIVGLPNIGKSTLFNALTNSDSPVADYPFCTIEPHISLIYPKDEKLSYLSELHKPLKTTPYNIRLHDIAGLVKGASNGEGLGNAFLENIRQVDTIIHVVKLFDNNNYKEDIKTIKEELRLKDLQILNSNKKKMDINLFNLLNNLLNEKDVREGIFEKEEIKQIIQLNFLTSKNEVFILNVSEEAFYAIKNKSFDNLTSSIKLELKRIKELMNLNPLIYSKSLIDKDKLVDKLKKALNIITYYTAGKKEVKGWTISNGTTANYAGKVIHTDFVSNFIAADVIKYSDVLAFGLECKKLGKVMMKGKTYVVEEGDVLEFKVGTKGKKRI